MNNLDLMPENQPLCCEPIPASPGQFALWAHSRKAPDSSAYNVAFTARLRGKVNRQLLKKTVRIIIQRHSILRTNFRFQNGLLYQIIHPDFLFNIKVIDAANRDENQLNALVQKMQRKPFDLGQDLLLRVYLFPISDTEMIFLLSAHHIVCDGWSFVIFLEEMQKIYQALEASREPVLEPLEHQYFEYTQWESGFIHSPAGNHQREFWHHRLVKDLPEISFEDMRVHSTLPDAADSECFSFQFPREEFTEIRNALKPTGYNLNHLFLSLFQIILHLYSGYDIITTSIPLPRRLRTTAGLSRKDFGNNIGYFVNMALIRTEFATTTRLEDVLADTREQIRQATENQDYPFAKLVEELNLIQKNRKVPQCNFVFQKKGRDVKDLSMFLFDTQGTEKHLEMGSITLEPFFISQQTGQFDLEWELLDSDGVLYCNLKYDKTLFDQAAMSRMVGHIRSCIRYFIANRQTPVRDIELVTAPEKECLLRHFNPCEQIGPTFKTIPQYLEEHAKLSPDKIALHCQEQSLTYHELWHFTRQISLALVPHAQIPETRIGILMERGIPMIASILGVWLTGCCYVPIDPAAPTARISEILEDAQIQVLLIATHDPDLEVSLQNIYQKTICNVHSIPKKSNSSAQLPQIQLTESSLAYIIYTSGSTGRPKGAMIEHGGMMNHLYAKIETMNLTANSVIAQNASQCFDISVWQMFAALVAGGMVVIYPQETILKPDLFIRKLAEDEVSVLEVVPSYLATLLDLSGNLSFRTLKYLLVTGEEVKKNLLSRWFSRYPAIPVINAYGPTEASDDITHHIMTDLPAAERIPIGRPIRNTRIYIVNDQMQLTPIGVKGEICVAGSGVGRGYINREAETQAVFVEDHFAPTAHSRLYKTGDLGRWLPNGVIEFFGRKDSQIKFNGFRIESGEIENRIAEIPGVRQAVVELCTQAGSKILCAYVVKEASLTEPAIRAQLKEKLPGYMIPGAFMFLETLPLTGNGKIDKKNLPALGPQSETMTESITLPANELQQQLKQIWEEVLGVHHFGIHADFFDLGGTSLQAIKAASLIQAFYNIELNLLFEKPTIAQLADYLQERERLTAKESLCKIKAGLAAVKQTDSEAIQKQISAYRDVNYRHYFNQALSNVKLAHPILLTGATGFLGIHLLDELLTATDSLIYVIIRDSAGQSSAEKLQSLATYYFGKAFYRKNEERIRILEGDVSKEYLGLAPSVYQELTRSVAWVFHAAANVRHHAKYESLYAANVLGTKNILDFCSHAAVKGLHHVSTISIASGQIQDQARVLFTEDFEYPDPHRIHNYYIRTKLEAEKLVNSYRAKGLNANIYRTGNLVFNSKSGIFQPNRDENAFYQLWRNFIKLGKVISIPEQYYEFSFVDFVSRAIVQLACCTGLTNGTYHLTNRTKGSFPKFTQLLNQVRPDLELLPLQDFLDCLPNQSNPDQAAEQIQNILIYSNLLSEDHLGGTVFTTLSERTDLILNKLGLSWLELEPAHVAMMLDLV